MKKSGLTSALDDIDLGGLAQKKETKKRTTRQKNAPVKRGKGGHIESSNEPFKRSSLDLRPEKARELKVWVSENDVPKMEVLRWLVDEFLKDEKLQDKFRDYVSK